MMYRKYKFRVSMDSVNGKCREHIFETRTMEGITFQMKVLSDPTYTLPDFSLPAGKDQGTVPGGV